LIEGLLAVKVVHVNVPYPMLRSRTGFALANRIHPEIYFSGDDLDRYDEKKAWDLAEKLHENGLEITFHGPFMDLSPGGVDARIKEVTTERFSKTLQLAKLFRPEAIVFHAGYEKWKFDGDADLWLRSSLQTWKPLVKMAEEVGVTLVLENVFEETPDPIATLLKEIGSPRLRFCLDTGHHHIFSRVPLSVWFETLGRYLSEIHLHDNHGETDEHLPIGEGSFGFDQLFTLLARYGLNPIYTLEPHQEDHLKRGLEAVKKYISTKSQAPNNR
jgi:sugar phosphate isomerase/epimerase